MDWTRNQSRTIKASHFFFTRNAIKNHIGEGFFYNGHTHEQSKFGVVGLDGGRIAKSQYWQAFNMCRRQGFWLSDRKAARP